MKSIKLIFLFIFISTISVGGQFANTSMTPLIKDIVLKKSVIKLGEAKFSVLFWDIYQSQLYTSTGIYPINGKDLLIFEINYLRDITSKDLIERTVEQWEHLNKSEKLYQRFIPILESIWPDIVEGDKLSIVVSKGQSYFYFNDQQVGVITDSIFSQLFLDIWLSENTSQPNLREQLLGIGS